MLLANDLKSALVLTYKGMNRFSCINVSDLKVYHRPTKNLLLRRENFCKGWQQPTEQITFFLSQNECVEGRKNIPEYITAHSIISNTIQTTIVHKQLPYYYFLYASSFSRERNAKKTPFHNKLLFPFPEPYFVQSWLRNIHT